MLALFRCATPISIQRQKEWNVSWARATDGLVHSILNWFYDADNFFIPNFLVRIDALSSSSMNVQQPPYISSIECIHLYADGRNGNKYPKLGLFSTDDSEVDSVGSFS